MLCKIADKWCGIECHASVYPYFPEWGMHWRYDKEGEYEVVTNDPKIHCDKITIGIIVSHERYENMNSNEKKELCGLERDMFIGLLIAADRDEMGIKLSKKLSNQFVKYLKDKCSFMFYEDAI